MNFTGEQKQLIESAPTARIWLSGKAGCGKSTAAAERVRFLMENGLDIPVNNEPAHDAKTDWSSRVLLLEAQ